MRKYFIIFAVILTLVAGLLLGCKAQVPAETKAVETTAAQVETTAAQAATTAAPKKAVTIGYVCKILDNPWFRPLTDKAAEIIKGYGGELLAVDAKMDPELYISSLDNLITQGVSGMMVTPVDQSLSIVTIEKCKAAGIPVLANDDPLIDNGKKLAPSFELDGYKSGYIVGEWLAKYVTENKLIKDPKTVGFATITCLSVSNFKVRTEGSLAGWKAVITDLPDSQYFTNDTATSLTEEAYNSMTALITANPNIKTWFVTSANDESEVGVVRALEVAGLDKTSYLASLGGYLAKDEWKKEFSNIYGALYISSEENGRIVGKDIMEWVLNNKIPYEEYKKAGDDFGTYPFVGVMVTPENYKEIMGKDAL